MSAGDRNPPSPPRQPDPDECCGSGCALCVFDRYQQALECYRAELLAWQIAYAGRAVGSHHTDSP